MVLDIASPVASQANKPEEEDQINEDSLEPEQPAETTGAMRTMPLGTGALYKCAVCGELVYENQLNFHVDICPDPRDEGGPETIAEGEEESETEGADEVAPLSTTPPNFEASVTKEKPHNDELSNAVAEPSPRKIIPSSREKENDFAQRHATQTQKAQARRNQIIEELKRKEGAECTFQPKILPRGTAKTCTRATEVSEGAKWSQRCEQKLRTERRKEIEQRAYADLTLKPKISRYAQEWSLKQQECLPVGQQPLSVFERLYQAALHAREVRSSQQNMDGALLGSLGVSQIDQISEVVQSAASTPNKSPQQRREDLLYNDAFARVDRRKILAESIHQNSEEAMRDKRQVLDRSRRLYWQMLERQIKVAFDGVRGDDENLKIEALDDFLIRFGCMKPKAERAHTTKPSRFVQSSERERAIQAADEEFLRVKSSLWKHLDPEMKGHVDILTLTVFFHVLMGAVDEADKNHASQSSRPNTCLQFGGSDGDPSFEGTPPRTSEILPGSPDSVTFSVGETSSGQPEGEPSSINSPIHTPARSGSGSGNMLAAIFEEDSHLANEAASRRAMHLDNSVEDSAELLDLLTRFDSTQIRSEFKQLCLNRLHYQSQVQQSTQIEPRFEEVSAPEILARSRAYAEKLIEREKVEAIEAGGNLSTHADLLHWRHTQAEARKEERRAQARDMEVTGCTFRPKVMPRPPDMAVEAPPRGSSRNEHLYSKARVFKERKEQRAKEESLARSENEIRGCTFRPDTGRSERSYNRTNEGAAPVPRGFYETRQRLRAANELQTQKRQQKEDRMSKIKQLGQVDLSKTASPQNSGLTTQSTLSDLSPRGAPLPPVAEDSRLQERPLSSRGGTSMRSPRTEFTSRPSGRVLGERSRMASPGNRVKSISPRGDSSQRASSGSAHRKPAGASPEPAPREAWGDGVGSNRSEGGNKADAPLAQFGSSEGAPKDKNTGASLDDDGLPPPLLYVDVNISPSKPPERIVLREGQSVAEVTADFAAKHALNSNLAQRLYALLTEVASQRQEQASP